MARVLGARLGRRCARLLLASLLWIGAPSLAGAPPAGWIENYRKPSDLQTYLQEQYRDALADRLVPYVYWYADWCPACRKFRRRVELDPALQTVFAGTRIVMLDFDEHKRNKHLPKPFRIGAPLLAPIEQDGTLGEPLLNGIPWTTKVPRNIKEQLCFLFSLRHIPGVQLARGCPQDVAR